MRQRFDVFGREIIVDKTQNGWRALIAGQEGKHRPADFQIPSNLKQEDILGYLDDLFHEYATESRPRVKQIS